MAALVLVTAVGIPARAEAQVGRDTILLREIVVTATRLPTPRDEVPVAVTVIGGEDLRSRGVSYVLDALRDVPGLAVVRSGSTGAVTSLFMRGGQSNYVRILVDGVPVNEPGGRIDLANLTTDNLERIEVVRGPASVLYGSDAVAGVVQIFTRRGAGLPAIEAGLLGGRYGTRRGEVTLQGGSDRSGYTASVSRFATGGLYPVNHRFHNWAATALVRFAPDARGDARLSLRHHDGLYRFPTDGAGYPSDSNQFTSARATTVGLEAGRRLGSRVETRLLLGWHDESDRAVNQPDSPEEADGYASHTSFRRSSADLRANLRAGSRVIVTVGAALEDQAFRNRVAFSGSFASGDTVGIARTNRALYAQALAGFGPLTLTGGARLDDNQAFGRLGTARGGMVLRVDAGTRLRASLGSAFKEPTFFENYGGGFSVGNPGLDPERADSWEAGLEQRLPGGRAELEATYFNQRFRDVIQYSYAGPSEPNYRNIAGAEARGLELEARARPGGSTALVARYTYLHTEVADSGVDGSTFAAGRRLLRRPSHAASLTLDRRFGERVRGGVSAQYVGERDDLDYRNADPVTFRPARAVLPAYLRVDLGGELDLVSAGGPGPGLALTLRVENLLDRRYQEVLYFPARGITWLVGARLRTALNR